MKRFAVFILSSIIVIFLADRLLTLLFDKLYTEVKTGQTGGKINYYLSKPTPEIVIMGNSRAFYQIIPDSFKRPAFNLGHAGQTQIFQTGLLKILESNSKLPPVILLHVEPDELLLGDYRDIQNLKYYYNKEDFVTRKLDELSPFEHVKFYLASYRYNGRALTLIKNFIQTKLAFTENNGYEAIPPTPRDSLNTIYSANKLIDNTNVTLNYSQIEYLKEYISICKKNNISLICFTSPLFDTKRSNHKTSAVMDSILRANDIRYINFLTQPIPELLAHPRYWKDAHHLNHEGARIESAKLANEIMNYLKDEK